MVSANQLDETLLDPMVIPPSSASATLEITLPEALGGTTIVGSTSVRITLPAEVGSTPTVDIDDFELAAGTEIQIPGVREFAIRPRAMRFDTNEFRFEILEAEIVLPGLQPNLSDLEVSLVISSVTLSGTT